MKTLTPVHTFTFTKDGTKPDLKDYFVSSYAKEMQEKITEYPKEEVTLGIFSAEQLGVTDWIETDFFGPKGYEHISKLGLSKCTLDDALYLRIAYTKQKLYEWIQVMHDPFHVGDYSHVFDVGLDEGDGRCVNGCNLRSRYELRSDDLVACRLAGTKPSKSKHSALEPKPLDLPLTLTINGTLYIRK